MIRIGSRGSQLALWQANHIADALRALGHEVSIEIIRTTGDRMQNIAFASVGAKGMFTREIEEALQANTIPTVEQNRLCHRDDRRRPPRDRAATRARTGQHGLEVSVSEPPGRLEVVAV